MHRHYTVLFFSALACTVTFTGTTTAEQGLRLTDAQRDKALTVLRGGFTGEDFWPAMHAAEALTIAGHGDSIIKPLRARLRAEKDDQRRCGLARELVRAGHTPAKRVLLEVLASEDDHGHIHAAESMYKVNVKGDGKLLRSAMLREDAKPALRIMAAAALAKHEDDAAMKFLRSQLSADDPDTFRIAAWVLARIGDKSDIPRIKRRLANTKNPLAQCFGEHALAALGDTDGKQALLRNLNSDDDAVRTYAATFAGEAKLVEAKTQLVKMLDDTHPDAAIRAAQSLLMMESKPSARR